MVTKDNDPRMMLDGLSAEDLYSGMNQMKTGMAVYDKNLDLIFANETIRGYLPNLYASLDAGLSMRESIFAQAKAIHPDMDIHKCEKRTAYIYDMIKSSGTLEVTTPSGLKLNSSYDETSQGNFIVTTTDVTNRVKNEELLTQARRNADAENTAKTEFLANMSHEIRTPLSGVLMAAQILRRQLYPMNKPELIGLADVLVESANHLNAIINDVLSLSKIEAGHVDIVLSENSLAEQLRTLRKAQEIIAEEKGIELKLVIDRSLPDSLLYDSVRVRQCVSNLMNNALKFTASGSVTVAALYDHETTTVTIHVVDTGVGIAADEQLLIFDYYAQSKHMAPIVPMGTGLGLAISRKLARLMGGDIKLVSKLGRGSAFTLTFASEPAFFITDVLDDVA